MVLCLTWEVDKIEIVNSYIKCSWHRQEAFAIACRIGVIIFFFFGVCHASEEREKRLKGKGAQKITPVLQAPDRLQS